MEKIFIIIPTYWGRPSGSTYRPEDAIFDHPTPVDGESTLPRLLDSLCSLKTKHQFTVLIITAAVAGELIGHAKQRIEEIIVKYELKLDLLQLCADQLDPYRSVAQKVGIDVGYINLSTYAGVRNIQLIAPHTLGAQVIIALDDDEVVKPDFMDTVMQSIKKDKLGVAGFYEDTKGSVFIREPEITNNIFLDKAVIMNDAARNLLQAEGRFVRSSIAFGGNMVFHRDLFSKVGFDPGITRGEDLDYVMNARLAGFDFWLDKHLRITHLPPHHYDSSRYAKMAEDIRRFIYEREKLNVAVDFGFSVPSMDTWMPYPGRFFMDDVEEQALEALVILATPQDEEIWGKPATVLERALDRAQDLAPEYFRFADLWQKMMHNLLKIL